MPDVSDTLAERYELEQVIASGGMATVWRARDKVLARSVAVKILHEHLAQDDVFLARFRREAVAAAGLTHPHVVSIYDTGEMQADSATSHYIVMEYCGGGTLGNLLKNSGPFASERVAAIGSTICDALAYAHSKDIIHRDVKPGNVLVGANGLLKVGDFGIAKAVSEQNDLTTTGKIMGTVAYISPEYAMDQELDARSDIYSLGVVLYELAAGRPPFQEDSSVATAMRHIKDSPPPLRSMRAGISRSLEGVITKALEKDPDQRYGSAGEMKEALDHLGGGSATGVLMAAPRTMPVSEGSSFSSESKWIAPVVALIVGAIIVAAAAAAVFGEDETSATPPGETAASGGAAIQSGTPADFDPEGDLTEDSGGLAAVMDGDPSTTWKTDTYENPLNTYKSGVGILFDLGKETDVVRVEVITPTDDLDLQILSGSTRPTSPEQLEVAGEQTAASGRVVFEVSASARFWVVWVTDLPNGTGGLAEIGEVKFFGR